MESQYDTATLAAMSEQDLRELNQKIVALIREKARASAFKKVMTFQIGQRVAFNDRRGIRRVMRIQRLNQKTVSGVEVDTAGNSLFREWRVAPSFLSEA